MKQFASVIDKIIPLNLNNVDTDMIIPAEHLKSISQSGFGEFLFSGLRKLYPDFILNNPTFQKRKILISKANFGSGSSREHAVWAIQQYGIEVVICSSFSDIFFNNSAKNGLLLISLPESLIEEFINNALNHPDEIIQINLKDQEIKYLSNTYHFDYDPYRKHCLLTGQDDLDFLLSQINEVEQYEKENCRISW